MSRRILLVRHPPVARRWAGRCYGASDMGWSREGHAMARALAERLAAEPIDAIVHSGLIRARRLAERLGARVAIVPVADARWRERDFGDWEGRNWQAIWRETGDLMDRMTTDPERFRPGGGETGAELLARAVAAFRALPNEGTTVVVSHGGPIASLRADLAGGGLGAAAGYIPACGTMVEIRPGGPAGGRDC